MPAPCIKCQGRATQAPVLFQLQPTKNQGWASLGPRSTFAFFVVLILSACDSPRLPPSQQKSPLSTAQPRLAKPSGEKPLPPGEASRPAARAQGDQPPLAKEKAPPAFELLRIATWNMMWLDADLNRGEVARSAADYERLAAYARELNADIIALQEIENRRAALRVFDPAEYVVHVAAGEGAQLTGFAYKKSLSVQIKRDHVKLGNHGLRSGADIAVTIAGRSLRLLSVHLKSGCFHDSLNSPLPACRKLKRQLRPLEQWVDARAAAGELFVVLGDFNRQFFRGDDAFWKELDDGQPQESDLDSPTRGERSVCWGGRKPDFIDHIVLSKSVSEMVAAGSFRQYPYKRRDHAHRDALSDHCPLSVDLRLRVEAKEARGATGPLQQAGKLSEKPGPPTLARQDDLGPYKGNIGKSGSRYYHFRGCPNYHELKIEPQRGEGEFESAGEAIAAGFEASPDCP